MWKAECQVRYNTSETATNAEKLYTVTAATRNVFILSIVLCTLNFFSFVFSFALKSCADDFYIQILMIVSLLLNVGICGWLISQYVMLTESVFKIDLEQLSFVIDNKCSDPILNYVFEDLRKDQSELQSCAITGIVLTTVTLIVQFVCMMWAVGYLSRSDKSFG